MARQVGRGLITDEAMRGALERIKPAAELQVIGGTDLAIEAATEAELRNVELRRAAPSGL